MDKKVYQKPAMHVIRIQNQQHLLAGSGLSEYGEYRGRSVYLDECMDPSSAMGRGGDWDDWDD